MNEKDFVQLAEEILESSPGTLKLSDKLEDVDWDSLADLAFIAEADAKLGIAVVPDKLRSCKTLDDVRALVAS